MCNCMLCKLKRKNEKLQEAFDKVGSWLSAALDDPKVCKEMKQDIRDAFDIFHEGEENA